MRNHRKQNRARWPGVTDRLWAAWQPSENVKLLGLSFAVGTATAIGVWLFREGIDFFQRVFREPILGFFASIATPLGVVGTALVLALAGLIVGYLGLRFVGEERLHGVASIME